MDKEGADFRACANYGALTVGCGLITAYYRMETLELFAKISLNAHLLGGAKEIPKAFGSFARRRFNLYA